MVVEVSLYHPLGCSCKDLCLCMVHRDCYIHTKFFYRFIYCSVLLLALFVRRFSIYIVVGPPTHFQRRSLLKIKVIAMTRVPVTRGRQSALKLAVIIPHTLYKRSKR